MLFNYFNIVFEVLACIFRALGACIILLPIAAFLSFVASDMCTGLTAMLGLMAAGLTAILAAAAVYMELEQAAEEVQAFRYWRAAVQNI